MWAPNLKSVFILLAASVLVATQQAVAPAHDPDELFDDQDFEYEFDGSPIVSPLGRNATCAVDEISGASRCVANLDAAPPPPAINMSAQQESVSSNKSNEDMAAWSNSFYKLEPLTTHFGARVLNLNLATQVFSSDFILQLKKDMARHRVLLFRDQPSISGQRQVDLSRKLGKVESTFYKHPKSPHPDIFRVSNDEDEGCTGVGRTGWHVDGTFMETPFMFQTMYFPSVAEGGDTHFVPLKELYERQTPQVKDRWDRLWMVTGRRQAPIHPLVYKHPFRGDTTMVFHCGEPFVSGWLEEREKGELVLQDRDAGKRARVLPSQVVQEELGAAIEEAMPEIGLEMKWKPGDFTINDNLGLAHYAVPGTQNDPRVVGLRILHRTTVIGGDETVPVKADGRRSFVMG